MNLKDIIKSIYEGLSGNTLSDLNYLKDLAEMYKGHKYEKQILQELSNLFFEIVSKEEMGGVENMLKAPSFDIEKRLKEVQYYIDQNDLNRALNLCEEIIHEYEEDGEYVDDDMFQYRCFNEPIQEILYTALYNVQQDIEHLSEDFTKLYRTYGNILFDLKNYEEAQQAYAKALRYNPMDFTSRSEYIRTFNYLDDFDTFLEKTDEAFNFAYTPSQYAFLFLNIGFYYWNIQYYDIAVACLYCSLSFDSTNEQPLEIIKEIEAETKQQWPMPEQEKIAYLFKGYEIPNAPNREIVSILYSYIKTYRHENEDITYYLCDYLYQLIPSDEILTIMNEIQDQDYVDLDTINEKELLNGNVLKSISRRYRRDQSDENLYDLLYVLNKMEVIVPGIYEDLGYEEGLQPDILKSDDGRLHFPVFTSEEEMPQDYASRFSRIHLSLLDCIASAKCQDVNGIVLNPFTVCVELNFKQLEMLEKMNHNIMN